MSLEVRDHLISEVTPELNGEKVKIAAFVHNIRELGSLIFLTLGDRYGTLQITAKKGVTSDEAFNTIKEITRESVIEVEGTVKESNKAPGGREVLAESITILSTADQPLPIDVIGTETNIAKRLDYRYIDMRRQETMAIFKIQSTILNTFANYFNSNGFMQIRTPTIISDASEGGSEVFPVIYFEKRAYLAQSPQLYKQMAMSGGWDKVFMIQPVFRAEKSNTIRHLNEITQMDIEVSYSDHHDAMKYLEGVFASIMSSVRENNEEELKLLGVEVEEPKLPFRKISYDEAVDILNENGVEMKKGEDFSDQTEKKLAEIIGLDQPFFIYDYPTDVRAFYSMPHEDRKDRCKSFDLIYKGMEMSSGAQRVHIPELLEKILKSRDMKIENFQSYIDSFKYGCPPHAGWSIGLERITMQLTNRDNIREASLFPRDRDRITP